MKIKDDIINFVNEYFDENGVLEEDEIATFVGELQKQISEMDFSVPDGTTIILYTGESNGICAWEIAEKTSKILGDNAIYISELPAGELLNNSEFELALQKLVGYDEDIVNKIVGGYSNNVRLEGGSCGYGDYLALDDFVSGMFVSKSTNASNNLIIFCPEQVDSRKVFPVTEMLEAFSSSTYEYLNGIPKSQLKALYDSGNQEAVLQILSRISREAVGRTTGLTEQAGLLKKAIGEGGILNSESSDFALNMYYDVQRNRLAAELYCVSKHSSLLSDYASGNCLINNAEVGKDFVKLLSTDTIKVDAGEVYELLEDGTKISIGRVDVVSVEEALSDGYKVIESAEGTYFVISKSGIIKLVDATSKAMLVIEAGIEFHSAWNEYVKGNYRTGSKQLITYTTSMIGSVAGSSLFTAVVGGIGLAVGATIGAPVMIFAGIVGCFVGSIIGESIGDVIGDVICDLFGYEDANYADATIAVRYDPLVIDLDGDGFELLSVKDGVYFDEDVRGLIEKTEWVAADDALLAIDLNGDGIINDGSELFGTSTLLADGTHAKSGFEALAQYDLNGDGVIDENDEVFAKLKVWQDKNGDGISQADELYSFADLGIENISLTTSAEDGRLTANINYKDGTTNKIGEFGFESESYNTLEKDLITVSEEIAGLPNIRSIGSIASLHTLMQLDETGTLKGYVEQFVKSSVRKEKEELVTKIIYFITGADDVAAGSRGSQFDAKKLTVIEQFMGREFVGTAGRNPVNTAASILEGVYTDIYNAYYSMLNAQTQLANYMGMVFWTEDENGGKYLNTDVFNSFVSVCAENGNDMTEVVAEMGRYIASINVGNKKNFMDYFTGYIDRLDYAKAITDACVANSYLGTDANDTYSGTASMDAMFGGFGNDTLHGNNGDDFLYGEEGNDSLYGGNGDDILVGGTGNDYLNGGYGNDTYIFNLGDGKDTIYDGESSQTEGKSERIVFGEGISVEGIRLSRNGCDLVIDYGENDSVTVQNAYSYQDGSYCVEYIEFADGSVLTVEDVQKAVKVRYGTESADTMNGYGSSYGYDQNETFYAGAGNDTVRGGDGKDTIYGEEGDDCLYGDNDDDILIGGTGNDRLEGGYGNDTYIFNLGDGKDTVYDYESSMTGGKSDRIVFGEGISAEDIRLSRNGCDLVIDYGENDSVTVQNAYYYQDGRCCVEYIEFADGSALTVEDVQKAVKVRYGTESADTMYGYDSSYGYDQNETFYAGAGNDTVRGGDGKDTIYGEEGDDCLYGDNDDDILIGGTGNDRLEGGYGNDTYIFNLGDGKDTVYDYESSMTGGKSDRIVFGEGISAEDIRLSRNGCDLVIDYSGNDRVTVQNAYYYQDGRCCVEYIEFADGSVLTVEDVQKAVKVRYGTESADTMGGYGATYGYDQNETFYAGAGNDTVRGGDGKDTIYGEEGDDCLYGDNDDDILIGGTGNDRLEGGYGNDTYIFNLGDGKDTVYDYESSMTGGKSDRIVFGEGISAEDIRLSRNGCDLVIDYSGNDRVTVQNAYYYQDDRCCVENVEFADGTKGTLDYANTRLNITSAPTEPEPTDETQIIEMKLSTEQSIEVQPTETELIENTEAIVDSSTDENFDEPISGQEVIQDTTPSEKMDTTVDNCVGILEDLYTSDQPSDEANNVEIPSEEESSAIYDNATDSAIDNIVNLLVQDMSESGTSTLSDSNTITDVNEINDNVQLWVS